MAFCRLGFNLIPPLLRYITGTINIGIAFSSVFGNTLMLFIVFSTRSLHTQSNFILGSLAMTDLLTGLLTEPMAITQIFSEDARQNCEFVSLRRKFGAYLTIASFSLISLVSYDRYVHLSKTSHYFKHMSLRKVFFLLILCWVLPVIMPVLQSVKVIPGIVYNVIVFSYLLMSFGVVFVSYISIRKIVKITEHRMSRHCSDIQTSRTTGKRLRSAKTILLLVFCFGLTSLPIALFFGILALQRITSKQMLSLIQSETAFAITLTLSRLNSGINPIIYYLKIPEFKARLKTWLHKIRAQLSAVRETNSDVETLPEPTVRVSGK